MTGTKQPPISLRFRPQWYTAAKLANASVAEVIGVVVLVELHHGSKLDGPGPLFAVDPRKVADSLEISKDKVTTWQQPDKSSRVLRRPSSDAGLSDRDLAQE